VPEVWCVAGICHNCKRTEISSRTSYLTKLSASRCLGQNHTTDPPQSLLPHHIGWGIQQALGRGVELRKCHPGQFLTQQLTGGKISYSFHCDNPRLSVRIVSDYMIMSNTFSYVILMLSLVSLIIKFIVDMLV